MSTQSRVFSSLLALVVTSLPTLAQEHPAAAPAQQRPTLGLVLQGGALGLAHVGVITWLEEHHIPVNYIAGTSMGGLVGGVYATGHNVAEMRKIVDGINWDQVMSGQIPFQNLRSAASKMHVTIPTRWSSASARACGFRRASIQASRFP